MRWIVHAGIAREPAFDALANAIRDHRHPLHFVATADGGARIVETDRRGSAILADPSDIPADGPIFVVGTTTMQPACRDLGWTPGYVDAPAPSECVRRWGSAMLNHDAQLVPVADLASDAPVFVRPDGDGKAFSGRLLAPEQIAAWRETLPHVDLVACVSSPKTIWSEYRVVLVDGRFVTGSRYRTGPTVAYQRLAERNRVVRFAESLAEAWSPRRLLCIDVADTPDGLKAIELNAPSSAGLYAIDVDAYVAAVSSL